MNIFALLIIQVVGLILLIAALWWVTKRRLGYRWATLGWGALAWPLSQIARMIVATPILIALGNVLDPAALATASVVLMVLFSGVFEETARWLVLRFWAKTARQWRDGVGFGLGHGGIEAVLRLVYTAITSAILLTNQEHFLSLAEMSGQNEAVAAVQQQIDDLAHLTLPLVTLSWYERALAIAFHVAMTLLILRAVRERKWQLWLLAVVLHSSCNAMAVALLPLGLLPVYIALTVVAAGSLWAVLSGPLSRSSVENYPLDKL